MSSAITGGQLKVNKITFLKALKLKTHIPISLYSLLTKVREALILLNKIIIDISENNLVLNLVPYRTVL